MKRREFLRTVSLAAAESIRKELVSRKR